MAAAQNPSSGYSGNVDYRVLMKTRETVKADFKESHTYDWGSELVRKHPDDPLVLCYAVSVFLQETKAIRMVFIFLKYLVAGLPGFEYGGLRRSQPA